MWALKSPEEEKLARRSRRSMAIAGAGGCIAPGIESGRRTNPGWAPSRHCRRQLVHRFERPSELFRLTLSLATMGWSNRAQKPLDRLSRVHFLFLRVRDTRNNASERLFRLPGRLPR